MKEKLYSQKDEEGMMKESALLGYLDGADAADPVPEAIRLWLSDKYMMRGVPFRYLAPDETMLPRESIRFFYIDPNWMDAVTAGALSIGRQTGIDGSVNAAVYPAVVSQAFRLLPQRRYRQMHENHKRAEILLEGTEIPDSIEEDTALCGFLLRSCLARYWKGMEVCGFANQQKRSILRMDFLASDIILCIFDGEIDRVLIREPAEELHFAVEDVRCGAEDHPVKVRKISGDVGKYTGAEAALPVNSQRRADIRALAASVQKALGSGADTVHSAELALQLLSSAESCEIQKEGAKKDGASACTDYGRGIHSEQI